MRARMAASWRCWSATTACSCSSGDRACSYRTDRCSVPISRAVSRSRGSAIAAQTAAYQPSSCCNDTPSEDSVPTDVRGGGILLVGEIVTRATVILSKLRRLREQRIAQVDQLRALVRRDRLHALGGVAARL